MFFFFLFFPQKQLDQCIESIDTQYSKVKGFLALEGVSSEKSNNISIDQRIQPDHSRDIQ
jgi:hypothetical protein